MMSHMFKSEKFAVAFMPFFCLGVLLLANLLIGLFNYGLGIIANLVDIGGQDYVRFASP